MIPLKNRFSARQWPTSCHLAAGFLLGLSLAICHSEEITIASPDDQIQACIASDAAGQLLASLQKGTLPILNPSKVGILINGIDLGKNATPGLPVTRVIRETYPALGAHSLATNWCREALIPITSGPEKTAWTLEVRVFNDGLAWRYRVPGTVERTINGETTEWNLPTGGTIWYQGSGSRDYEKEFVSASLDTLPQDKSIMSDCLIQLPGKLGYVMPTEANLVHYSDMILQPTGTGRFQAVFPHDAKGWKQKGEITSPWRVTLFSTDLNGLVNSDLLRNLCPPPSPELARADWIQPGRTNWHWMVSGKPKLAEQRQWIDWTRQLGWEYYLIDDGWNVWGSDTQNPWQAMKEVCDYAKTQNVKIWAWVHTREVTDTTARIAYFEKAKATGLAGLKIDFMGPPNAGWVQWYDETLRDAAKAGLMVNFHGCVKPTGRERTWPHEMTREGIRGRENGKQTGLHDTTLPFTRYVQGHADFTPTDWRGNKLKGASWAHELAQAIVYTSPLLCFSGDPQNYLENEAAEVLKSIPSTWDETIVLPRSAVGEVAAFARRKGSEWYLGVINGRDARKLDLPLTFLGSGTWKSDQLGDSPEKNDAWHRQKTPVTAQDTLHLDLRAEGGFVARLTR